MYAIVEIAGQQFKVVQDQKLYVHRLADKEGAKVSFDQVYLLDDGKKVTLGAPAITGASVEAKVVSHLKGDKVIVFKKKRRKGYRVKNGHRQALTELVIEKIQASGAKPKAAAAKAEKAAPAKAAKPAATKAAAKKPAPAKAAKPAATKAPAKTDYSAITVAQLKDEAKKKGIEGITSMKKADLIAALSKKLVK
ncbi:MAG: 50S ribosomal protein L21 [Flavobacteriaceae bacterium]